ncbi:MAG: sigma-70 family RNA polymerase sigma factor [Acidobacteria bacterium]|nr:sigma-70 family RNA polymerase sigma factor [Acidobacteriota bacterium]MBI3427642.1 sigma-70 family RNA polymerase sigma factor [Acidobacteriota bacterium]
MTRRTRESDVIEINAADLRAFLAWLTPEQAANGEAYESARRRLMLFFAGRTCSDPESLADQTIDCAIRKLPDIPPEATPLAYLLGIAKNIYRDHLRATQKAEPLRPVHDVALSAEAHQHETEQRHQCLEQCLAQLPAEDRALVLGYYREAKQQKIDLRRHLAAQFGLTQNALRNRIFRLNQRLALCLNSCLEHSLA